jgi:lipopolysaccharide/colanic/teichoic acid biosynthesis glycosyltransferase
LRRQPRAELCLDLPLQHQQAHSASGAAEMKDELQMGSEVLKFKSLEGIASSPKAVHGEVAPAKISFTKRALDIFCLILALPTLLPLMLGIAALIKIVSPGPVFFMQDRIGFMGRRFRMFKFRTMKVNAETSTHQQHLKDLIHSNAPMTKLDNRGDPRVIKFGGILRSSGLDELPQLINVVRGEMSLVGPRPCTPYEYEQFQPWHKQRFRALPGLTGLWQVSGKNRTTFNEMIELDIRYAKEWSLWMDVRIISLTVPVLLNQVKEQKLKKSNATCEKQKQH